MTTWLQKKLNNFVVIKDDEMPLVVLRGYEQVISVRNFALKFQAVAQKMANNFRGYFFAAHCISRPDID